MQGHQIISFRGSASGGFLAVTTARRRKQRGMTLIETAVVVSIVGVLAGLAVPSYQGFQERFRLEGYAMELVTDIHYVRSEAVARNRAIRISFGSDTGGTCYMLHTGSAADCNCSSGGSAHCSNPNNSILKTVGVATAQGVHLQSNVASILFEPSRGMATPVGSINFTATSGKTIRQVVNIMGRTRTCSPNGGVIGYKVC